VRKPVLSTLAGEEHDVGSIHEEIKFWSIQPIR